MGGEVYIEISKKYSLFKNDPRFFSHFRPEHTPQDPYMLKAVLPSPLQGPWDCSKNRNASCITASIRMLDIIYRNLGYLIFYTDGFFKSRKTDFYSSSYILVLQYVDCNLYRHTLLHR